jgi:hypothetical protein
MAHGGWPTAEAAEAAAEERCARAAALIRVRYVGDMETQEERDGAAAGEAAGGDDAGDGQGDGLPDAAGAVRRGGQRTARGKRRGRARGKA